jgi:hypothetical protein
MGYGIGCPDRIPGKREAIACSKVSRRTLGTIQTSIGKENSYKGLSLVVNLPKRESNNSQLVPKATTMKQ